MKLTLDIHAPAADALNAAKAQLVAQSAEQSNTGPLVDGVLYLVAQELNGVAPGAPVDIVATLDVTVTKPGVAAHEQ